MSLALGRIKLVLQQENTSTHSAASTSLIPTNTPITNTTTSVTNNVNSNTSNIHSSSLLPQAHMKKIQSFFHSAPSTPSLGNKRKLEILEHLNPNYHTTHYSTTIAPAIHDLHTTPSVKRIRLFFNEDSNSSIKHNRFYGHQVTTSFTSSLPSTITNIDLKTENIPTSPARTATPPLMKASNHSVYASPPSSGVMFDGSPKPQFIPVALDSHEDHSMKRTLNNMPNITLLNDTTKRVFEEDIQKDEEKSNTERRARVAIRTAISKNAKLTVNYEIGALLGWGGNGAVLAAKTRSAYPADVAIKLIYKRGSNGHRSFPVKTEKTGLLPWEIQILSQIHQENVLKFVEWFEDDEMYFMVTERFGHGWKEEEEEEKQAQDSRYKKKKQECVYCVAPANTWIPEPYLIRIPQLGGSSDLFSFIDYYNSQVPTSIIKTVFRQIAHAVRYLHSLNVVHGDLKEENVLIARDLSVRVCDFGHSRQVKVSPLFMPVNSITTFNVEHIKGSPTTQETRKHFAFYGTTEMTGPELFSNIKEGSAVKTPNCIRARGFELDVWALGLLLYSLCFGSLPPHHTHILHGEIKIDHLQTYPLFMNKRKKRRKDIPPGCVDLLQKMLIVDPLKRWNMEQICSHPWLK